MIRLKDEEATLAFGRRLGERLMVGDVIALSGPLGTGKTVMARGILQGLGYVGEVPSPTFPIVIPYDPPDVRLPVAHVDLYRIDDEASVEELGLDEALETGAVVIEWPARLGRRLWPDALQLTLDGLADGARGLTAKLPPAWEIRWPCR